MNPPVIPVVVPVYNPPIQFAPFIRSLQENTSAPIILINDGSDKKFSSLFHSLGTHRRTKLITHEVNKGKGAALKTAMRYVSEYEKQSIGIITADADGQHITSDILACERIAKERHPALIIGARVDRARMPLRSRFGNAVTRTALQALHRQYVLDTQSGLRYIPKDLFAACGLSKFDKYDFELDMIIHAVKARIPIVEYPIQTIYINHNKASHYKLIKDTAYVAQVFFHHLSARAT